MTHPTERRNITYCPSPDGPATEAWIKREGWYGVREEIEGVLQQGACVEPGKVAYPWEVLGQWRLGPLQVRRCSYNPANQIEVLHDDDGGRGWACVMLPRDWVYRCHHFARLLHERMAFDAGRLPVLPDRFVALDVQHAVEATYAREEQREAVPA